MTKSGKGSQLGRDYFWNTASSLIGSVSMVLMPLVVSRTAGVAAAGVFIIATAIGQQFQTLGAFEVRPFQATDVQHKFSFGTYFSSRLVTVFLMVVGIIGYILISSKPGQDITLVFLVAFLRVFDAFEDVFYGEMQRDGRLDVAGRANFWRVFITTITFIVSVYVSDSLLLSTVVTIVVSILAIMILVIPPAAHLFSLKPSFAIAPMKSLLLACTPLFISAFLSMYLMNAPRFAIESHMTSDAQASYGFIFMPALAINIMAMFVFRPLLTRMAQRWHDGDRTGFVVLLKRGLQGVAIAFVLTLIMSYLIGIPLLSWLYSADLDGLRPSLLILVIGGALNALGIILYYALTTMRCQRLILAGYAGSGLGAWILANHAVQSFGIIGAAIAYAVSVGLLAAYFFVVLVMLTKDDSRWKARSI